MSDSVEILRLEPIAIRSKQAAALIGVSPRKFAEMRACGQLPKSYKLNGCVVCRTLGLKQWVDWGFQFLDKFLALQKENKK